MRSKTMLDVSRSPSKKQIRTSKISDSIVYFSIVPISIIISGTIEPRHSLDYGNSTGTLNLTITQPSLGIIDTKYKQLSFSYSNSKWPRPLCNFEFFIEVSQGLLRTAPGLVRTCEIFENWGNPWQSLESLSYPVKDLESLSCPGKNLSPLECQYGMACFL